MVRAKVIASTAGAAVAAIVVLLTGLDKELGGTVGDFVEVAVVAFGAFAAGYAKTETRSS
jgi:hypothetical protein